MLPVAGKTGYTLYPLWLKLLGDGVQKRVRPLHGLAISFSIELEQARVLGTFSSSYQLLYGEVMPPNGSIKPPLYILMWMDPFSFLVIQGGGGLLGYGQLLGTVYICN